MELVNQFNSELSSLYDSKPPISKGKMTSVTKAALKAVKLYKHVVQSVEKFIQKCKPEYKIPGLYVIDSIIRQSRHQFGIDKDIFAGRFQRNLQTTFSHLFRCSDEDKPKVIRVLNLWQKNKIYTPEVIQPLIDMADPNNPIWETIHKQEAAAASSSSRSANNNNNNTASGGEQSSLQPLLSDQVQFKKELLDYDYEEDDGDGGDRNKGQPQQQPHNVPPPPMISLTNQPTDFGQNNFAGFDALGSILTNPEVLRQLQTLQEQMAAAAQQQQQQQLPLTPEQERQRKMAELNKQEAAFDQRLAQTVSRLPFAVEFGEDGQSQGGVGGSPRKENNNAGYLQPLGTDQNSNQLSNHQAASMLLPPPFFQQLSQEQQKLQQSGSEAITIPASQNPFGIPLTFPVPPPYQQNQQHNASNEMYNAQQQETQNPFAQFQPPQSIFEQQQSFEEERERERERERDRGGVDRHDRRRRRSRSDERHRRGSRSPSNKFRRRSRSSSRNRNRKSRYRSRSRDRERKEERERERERQRKGFPPPRKEHLSVCSTTLWVGHLSRQVAEEELSDTFGAYGDIVSIELISSRGCAFVVMNRRQDAAKALDRLKNTKLQSKTITLAWAPGKGVKGRDWKDYWEVEAGVSYIPWSKLSMETDLEEFEDGGCIDEDTLPSYLKNKPKVPKSKSENQTTPSKDETSSDGKSGLDGTPTKIDQITKPGDVDTRQDMTTSLANPTPVGPPPGMVNTPFGIPPTPVGLMPPMVNMMMPPTMLGAAMGVVAPQFTPMGFPMMGQMSQMGLMPTGGLPAGMGGQPDLSQIKPGLLGEMPMQHIEQMQLNNNPGSLPSNNIGGTGAPTTDEEMVTEENRKRHPEKREARDRKRSRFDDSNASNSPSGNITVNVEESPSNFDDRSMFERQADGFGGFPGTTNPDNLTNSLLGAPLGQAPGLRPPMPGPRGFPSPRLPRGGAAFGSPRKPWMENRDGSRGPWMDDASQNPFINPGQNPFAGSPFVQQNSENPFELAAAGGPQTSTAGDAPFFGRDHFGGGRGGWRGGDRGGGWRGDRGGMRGGRGGMRGGRGGVGWQGRDEEWGNDRDQRGFRSGGRGGRRGGDFDRGRRRDWGGEGGGRDQEWNESGRGDRDRSRGREKRLSFDKENPPFMNSASNIIDENWDEDVQSSGPPPPISNNMRMSPRNNFENQNYHHNQNTNINVNMVDEVWDEEPPKEHERMNDFNDQNRREESQNQDRPNDNENQQENRWEQNQQNHIEPNKSEIVEESSQASNAMEMEHHEPNYQDSNHSRVEEAEPSENYTHSHQEHQHQPHNEHEQNYNEPAPPLQNEYKDEERAMMMNHRSNTDYDHEQEQEHEREQVQAPWNEMNSRYDNNDYRHEDHHQHQQEQDWDDGRQNQNVNSSKTVIHHSDDMDMDRMDQQQPEPDDYSRSTTTSSVNEYERQNENEPMNLNMRDEDSYHQHHQEQQRPNEYKNDEPEPELSRDDAHDAFIEPSSCNEQFTESSRKMNPNSTDFDMQQQSPPPPSATSEESATATPENNVLLDNTIL